MAEGDSFLGFLKDTVNSAPILGTYSYAMWGRGNYNPNPAPKVAAPDFTDRMAEWVNVIPFAGVAGQATQWGTENVAPLKFVLDFGMRTVDSFANGFQYNDTMNDTSLSTWAQGWRKSWDSFGTADHVSAGQLVGAQLNESFEGETEAGPLRDMNPFTQQGVAAITELSKRDWYGNIAGGILDLTAPSVPYAALGKVARTARESGMLRSLNRVEGAERAFNGAIDAGTLDNLSQQRGRSFFRSFADMDASGESYAARLRDLARETIDHATDNTTAMNFLAPRMENASPIAQRFMMETAVYARRLGRDLGTEAVGNAWLSVMGSANAAKRLEGIAPALVDRIATVTGPPEVLSTFAKARARLLEAQATGGDIRIEQIISETMETPRKKAQHAILKSELERAREEAIAARDIRGRINGLKPQFRKKVDGQYVDDFDVARLKETRGKAEAQYLTSRDRLAQAKAELKEAKGSSRDAEGLNRIQRREMNTKPVMQDGAEASKNKTRRDAYDAFGPQNDAEMYAREAGATSERVKRIEARIKELEDEVAEAKGDRDLLASTPLNDPDAMAKWRDEITSARAGVKTAQQRRDMLASMERIARRELKDDRAHANQMLPGLNASNDWLVDFAAAKSDGAVLSVAPSLLAKAKTAWRDKVGETFMFETGEFSPRAFIHRHPKEQMATIGTAYGRSSINVHDRYIGQQELGMYLRKSGVFEGDEIRGAVNEMLAANGKNVSVVLDRLNDEMIERILIKEGVDPRAVQPIIADARRAMQTNRRYLTQKLDEADADGSDLVRTVESPLDPGVTDAFDYVEAPFLRPHLADTVPFTDPQGVRQLAKRLVNDPTLTQKIISTAGGSVDVFNHFWKMAALLRPGLFFRNMLDTGLRATMLMGTMETLATADRGAWNLVRNSGLRANNWALRDNTMRGTALQRIGIRRGNGEIVKHSLTDSTVKVDIGGGKTRTLSMFELQDGHATAASQAALGSAMNKGVPIHEGIMGNQLTPFSNDLVKNVQKWDYYKAHDPRWPEAYQAHAQALLASPTAKRMIADDMVFDDGISVDTPDARVRRLFSDPDVRDEYAQLAARREMTREQFIEQLDHEMNNMFPTPEMAKAVLSGRLKEGKAGARWVEENFPPEARFNIPGYESILKHNATAAESAIDTYNRTITSLFDTLMDKPDLLLVDNPTGLAAYKSQIRFEAGKLLAARRAKFGDDAVLTERDIRTIDQRSRTFAVSQVRKYMYDATRRTEFSEAINRLSPFFNPWYDSARAYSKLAYDNPAYLGLVASAWNAPQNLSPWLSTPLVVDVNGQAVPRGAEPEQGRGERFLVLNSLIGGKKPFGMDLKIRQSSLNTILQGDTPWLPGWGPTVTVPLAPAINTNEDLALWLSEAQDPFLHTLMKSLYPDGEIPRNDQVIDGIKPAHLRKLMDVVGGGDTYWANVQFGMNQRYVDSLRTGEVFDEKRAHEEAKADARTAGYISWVAQFGLGLSPQTDVAGRFFVNEMHAIQSMPIETVRKAGYPSHQAMFTAMHPDAGNLTWTFTRNETGINATIKAQDRAHQFRDLIETQPEVGWFIVGEDNVGGDFSQTAYNQQRADTYGIQQAGRKRLEDGDVMEKVLASTGWDQYTKFINELNAKTMELGLSTEAISFIKSDFANWLGTQNTTWYRDYNERLKKLPVFFKQADEIAADPRMRSRQDIGMYTEYRGARQQILDHFGIRSLDGTGQDSVIARAMLRELGTQLAAQNIGFQQMWDRMLAAEVEQKATDARFTDGALG